MTLFRTTRGLRVVAGEDAGGYYCEHLLYVTLAAALAPGSSVRRDPDGDPMVGFLHVPRAHDHPDAADRHGQTVEVVAAALRGWSEAAGEAPLRLLLTGFGPFRDVTDNPTGAFVNDDAAVARALDLARVTPTLRRRRFDVDGSAIDGGPASIQAELAAFAPDAVLCLGVGKGDTYVAETRATARALTADGGPEVLEDHALPVDASLARAISAGGAWLWRPC